MPVIPVLEPNVRLVDDHEERGLVTRDPLSLWIAPELDGRIDKLDGRIDDEVLASCVFRLVLGDDDDEDSRTLSVTLETMSMLDDT